MSTLIPLDGELKSDSNITGDLAVANEPEVPFLIAHIVRGKPAFDVAIQMEIEGQSDSPWWIVATSGHRAYPYWHTELLDLKQAQEREDNKLKEIVPLPPPNHRDHYHVNDILKNNKPKKTLLELDLSDLEF